MTQGEIEALTRSELDGFQNSELRAYTESILVPPKVRRMRFERRGLSVEMYDCWVVANPDEYDLLIAYAEGGYGKIGAPWGLIGINGDSSGPPNGWYKTLEECIVDSGLR